MCTVYEDSSEGVNRKCNNEEDKEDNESSSSSSNSLSMESASGGYYSPGSGSKTPSVDHSKVTTTDGQSMKSENSCYSLNLEDTSEVVKETLSVEPVWSTYKSEDQKGEEDHRGRTVENLMKETEVLRDRLGEREIKFQNPENKPSAKVKELEDRVLALKIEIENLNDQEREEEFKSRHDEFHKKDEGNSGCQPQIQPRVFEIESALKETEFDLLKNLDECEKTLRCKIDKSMERVQNMRKELESLRSQNDEARKNLLLEKEKELEFLRIQTKESEMEVKKKTEEAAEECEKILKGKIVESMGRVQNMQIEVDSLRSQNDEARQNLLLEKEKEVEFLRMQNKESEMEVKKKTEEVAEECEKILKGKIFESMDRVLTMQMEVDSLRSQNAETRYEKEKELESLRSQNDEDRKNFLLEKDKELESLRSQNDEDRKNLLSKKEKELESLRSQNDEDRKNFLLEKEKELESLRSQNDEDRKNFLLEKEKELEFLKIQTKESEMEVKKKTEEVAEECEKILKGKIVESMGRVQTMQIEVDSLRSQNAENRFEKVKELESLRIQIQESEMELKKKTEDVADVCEKIVNDKIEKSKNRIHNAKMEVDSLRLIQKRISYEKEREIDSLSILNQESEVEIQKKTKEASDSLQLLEHLTDTLNQKTINEEHLKKQVKDLEVRIANVNGENQKQKSTISQLEKKLQSKETQISNLESKSEKLSNMMKILEQKFISLEIDKRELEGKNDVLVGALEQKDLLAEKLNEEAKATFKLKVKKMGHMMEEFRKNSEDGIRILGRRIRVAEQIQNETRDWYKKTKGKLEQDKIDGDTAIRTIKLVMTAVSDTLTVSETLGLRFAECCEDFMNRVSKVYCEMNFAKDWVRRKNVAMKQLKENFDAAVVELNGKEEEVLRSRQKVLKLEIRLRELEKTVKDNDEAIIVLKEEKREAIRHLCVWTDYHRSRADFLKKSLSDLVAKNPRPVTLGRGNIHLGQHSMRLRRSLTTPDQSKAYERL